jgi:hypoxanthine phosphoribosyltransferase
MNITVHDKTFEPFLSEEQIDNRVRELAARISEDYAGKRPLFLGVLNGSFVFAADLFRRITVEAEISFVKLASYKGTSSTGSVVTAIGLEESLHERHVIIVEDIIDTGRTMHHFLKEVNRSGPASVRIATFLSKPEAIEVSDVSADYIGFEIPTKFVLGYGLDYDGLGRNLPELYTLVGGE